MKEALNNAAKYSHAEHISIDWKNKSQEYMFIITDDGKGIEEGVVHGSGNGMINMKKRMENVGGSFNVESEPGKGTRIILGGMLYWWRFIYFHVIQKAKAMG